mgnify:FL=1
MLDPNDLTSPNPADAEGAENQPAVTTLPAEPQVDWEVDTNPYRKRYTDSQSQVQPLVRTLQQFAEFDHNTRTWKPKAIAPATPEVSNDTGLEAYDPEFKKALSGFTQKQVEAAIAKYRRESEEQAGYNTAMQEGRSKAIREFGEDFNFAKDGKMNPASPLYQLANEILTNKYAILNPDGSLQKYNNAEAEYLATTEAYAILSKRAKQPPVDKGKLNAIQGKGTKSAGIKKELSYEEYDKLPEAEKDAYDLAQKGG